MNILVISTMISTYLQYLFTYSCWIQYDNSMLFAEIIPITLMVVASIMMIEAAGSVDESTMTRLEGLLLSSHYQVLICNDS